MNKNLIFLLLLLNYSTQSISQTSTNTKIFGQGDFTTGFWVTSEVSQRQIEGTQYLFDNWLQSGKIYFTDKIYLINSINYNIQAERFEFKISNDSVFALNHGSFYKVEIKGKFFSRHLDPDYQRNTYFEDIIHFKNKLLLKKYEVKIIEGQINPLTMQKLQQDKFVKNEKYYILNDNSEETVKIKLKKSTIMSFIEEKDKSITKDFARENGLSFNKTEDVVKILEYYNSL